MQLHAPFIFPSPPFRKPLCKNTERLLKNEGQLRPGKDLPSETRSGFEPVLSGRQAFSEAVESSGVLPAGFHRARHRRRRRTPCAAQKFV